MKEYELGHTIKELSDIQFPAGLHGKIMRQLVFLKFRTPFMVVVSLLSANLIFNVWRMGERFSEEGFATLMSIFLDNFEFTLDFAGQLMGTIAESTPWMHLGVVVVNVLLLGYVARLPLTFRKLVKNA